MFENLINEGKVTVSEEGYYLFKSKEDLENLSSKTKNFINELGESLVEDLLLDIDVAILKGKLETVKILTEEDYNKLKSNNLKLA